MSNADDGAKRLRVLTNQLLGLGAGVEGIREQLVLAYLRTLFAYSNRADGSFSGAELGLMAAYFRDFYTWSDEVEEAREHVLSNPEFLSEVPGFLRRAKVHDRRQGTMIAAEMVEVILAVCQTISEIDNEFAPEESSLKNQLSDTYRTFLAEEPNANTGAPAPERQ